MSAENILLSPSGQEEYYPTIPEDNITIREDYRKKIELKHQKTIEIGEAKHLAISSLSSNAV